MDSLESGLVYLLKEKALLTTLDSSPRTSSLMKSQRRFWIVMALPLLSYISLIDMSSYENSQNKWFQVNEENFMKTLVTTILVIPSFSLQNFDSSSHPTCSYSHSLLIQASEISPFKSGMYFWNNHWEEGDLKNKTSSEQMSLEANGRPFLHRPHSQTSIKLTKRHRRRWMSSLQENFSSTWFNLRTETSDKQL